MITNNFHLLLRSCDRNTSIEDWCQVLTGYRFPLVILWMSSTTLTSSISSLQKYLWPPALPLGWPESLQCLPAQYELCDPRRHMNRRSPVLAGQNALQQFGLGMFLPKPATFMEFASDRLHHSAMRNQHPQMGPLPLGPWSLHRWEQVYTELMWQVWESGDAVENVLLPTNVLQHELRRTSCIHPSAVTSGTSTCIIVFLLKSSPSRS